MELRGYPTQTKVVAVIVAAVLKAALVVQLGRLIKGRKLSQVDAAKLLGVKQPDLSNILRGHYRGYSLARLMRMLTAFDQDVEITTRPHRKVGEAGRIIFSPHVGCFRLERGRPARFF